MVSPLPSAQLQRGGTLCLGTAPAVIVTPAEEQLVPRRHGVVVALHLPVGEMDLGLHIAAVQAVVGQSDQQLVAVVKTAGQRCPQLQRGETLRLPQPVALLLIGVAVGQQVICFSLSSVINSRRSAPLTRQPLLRTPA